MVRRSRPLTFEELGEDLCNFCECTDYGNHEMNNAPYNLCFGSQCDEAYQNYLNVYVEEQGEG